MAFRWLSRYMAEILLIPRKTLNNQSINQSINQMNQSIGMIYFILCILQWSNEIHFLGFFPIIWKMVHEICLFFYRFSGLSIYTNVLCHTLLKRILNQIPARGQWSLLLVKVLQTPPGGSKLYFVVFKSPKRIKGINILHFHVENVGICKAARTKLETSLEVVFYLSFVTTNLLRCIEM